MAQVVAGAERAVWGLDHSRAGELIARSTPNSWFAYPYWLDDRRAPDFARTVDIHRKCGFDPCEMFFDPKITFAKGRVAWRLLQKKLGFRVLFDVIPLDTTMVRGSHGLQAADPLDRPLLIAEGPPPPHQVLELADVYSYLLRALSDNQG